MKPFLIVFLFLSSFITAHDRLSFNQTPPLLSRDLSQEMNHLILCLSDDLRDNNEYYSVIMKIEEEGAKLVLDDASVWVIGRKYRSLVNVWKIGDKLKIFYHPKNSNDIEFVNARFSDSAWGVIEQKPPFDQGLFILHISNSALDSQDEFKFTLNNGMIFKGPRLQWKVRDPIFVFHHVDKDCFDLWNLKNNDYCYGLKCLGNEKKGSLESSLHIEKRLSQHVLGQDDVIQTVASTLINCWAGLNDPKTPIGVFLFLGPTGVGKTELAKALAQELYKNQHQLIRLDMSHFSESYTVTRLIGSAPGYVNHEQGGQLTEALRAKPQSIVLLDEIEKAHPSVRKIFLPVLDEGYIVDAKNNKILCNRAIFIMTGNICSTEITQLFNEGYSSDEILRIIEPIIIDRLSPEFYNRLSTVIFRPLTHELMGALVDQKLKELNEKLKKLKKMTLIVDQTAKDYLIEHGFHPTLGARPLKRLIQNTIITNLSYAILNQGIPEGSHVTLFYSLSDDTWHIDWI